MPSRLPPLQAAWHTVRRLVSITASVGLRHRVTGLGAEAAFFAILSLPPLVFGLAGAIGFVAARYEVAVVSGFREQVLDLSERVLTDETVATIIRPTLDEVLSGGRFEIISIGFVIALWSGSRALNVLVDAITIMYGMAGQRGIIRTRALSFGLYLLFLMLGVVVLPAGARGTDAGRQPAPPARLGAAGIAYWPIVLVGTIGFLTTLFHVSVPGADTLAGRPARGGPDPADLAGRQRVLRLILSASAGSPSIYGPLAAPIALLVWLYLICIAILIGAAFNVAVDAVWPELAGIGHEGDVDLDTSATGPRPPGLSK